MSDAGALTGDRLASGWHLSVDGGVVRLRPGANRWPLGSGSALADTVAPGATPGLEVKARVATRLGRPGAGPLVVRIVRHLIDVAQSMSDKGQVMADVDPFALLIIGGQPRLAVGPLATVHHERVAHAAPEAIEGALHGHGIESAHPSVIATYAIAAAAASVAAGRYLRSSAERIAAVDGLQVGGLPFLLARSLDDNPALRPDLDQMQAAMARIWDECQPRTTGRIVGFSIGHRTTVGLSRRRSTNEDSCGWVGRRLGSSDAATPVLMAVVADGVGGRSKGAQASAAAVAAFLASPLDSSDVIDASAQRDWTLTAAEAARRGVSLALGPVSGGTTLTAVVIVGRRVTVAHVGDSRAYLLGFRSPLQQLTTDHTVAAALVAGGFAEEEDVDRERTTLTRALLAVDGERMRIDALDHGPLDAVSFDVRRGDTLVLCTDGVWSVGGALGESAGRRRATAPTSSLGDSTVDDAPRLGRGTAPARPPDPQELADRAIRRVLRGGGADNATIVVVQV